MTSGASSGARPGPLASLFSQLKLIGGRSGEAVGDAYAQAARTVLNRVEQLEDLNAERRYEARLAAARATRAQRRPKPSLPPSP